MDTTRFSATNSAALRIVFMGTPEFAVASLDALVQAGFNIVAVVTAPDKLAGRGMKLTESAVKKYAVANHLTILQPEKLKSPEFIEALQLLKADLQIVVAFRMLPEVVWNMPPQGTINLHGSLLPQYRGAAPINWAVINGEKETGVTTFKLKHEIDTGNILMQRSFPIGEDDTAGDVHDRMKEIGAALLVETVHKVAEGGFVEIPQPAIENSEVDISHPMNASGSLAPETFSYKHAPKIFTDTCKIDWHKSVEEVHNLIRGLSPYPGAFSFLNNKMMKIFSSKKELAHLANDAATQIGKPVSDGKTFLKFTCNNGYIHVLALQIEGKKKMQIEEFLRGYKL